MKAILTIITVLATVFLIVSCTTVKPTTTEVILLRDITEKSLANPEANEISGFFDLSNNPWNGARFYFENVTDVSYNPVNEVKISAQNEWLSNEPERKKEIKKFNNTLSVLIANSEKDTVGKAGSAICFPFIRTLNQLSQSKSSRRVLIIYSDLMENTKDISFYRTQTMNLLKTNPEVLAKQFEVFQSIPNLKGIEVYIIFQPVNKQSDSDFKTVSEFYKKMLEDKGATVTISANLNS